MPSPSSVQLQRKYLHTTKQTSNKTREWHGAEVKRVILTLWQRSPTQDELVTAHESCEPYSLIGEMFKSGERKPFALCYEKLGDFPRLLIELVVQEEWCKSMVLQQFLSQFFYRIKASPLSEAEFLPQDF
ncbi:hypothetical protein HNY73_002364 [Argiope bruennichi]|uniref:Uncharacterized protein n=1 Tax=Argiope bruennichi TaxID=94029 RepID=A0A8T0FUC5_ARGBR|nr:hypothetical protein HNY73_002364 [Argiope bruennichi]